MFLDKTYFTHFREQCMVIVKIFPSNGLLYYNLNNGGTLTIRGMDMSRIFNKINVIEDGFKLLQIIIGRNTIAGGSSSS